jgi:predicted transcriptional regulator
MKEITDDKLRETVMNIWLQNPMWGQNKIAKEIGITALTYRKFINSEVENLKMTTKMRILSWINKMEGA